MDTAFATVLPSTRRWAKAKLPWLPASETRPGAASHRPWAQLARTVPSTSKRPSSPAQPSKYTLMLPVLGDAVVTGAVVAVGSSRSKRAGRKTRPSASAGPEPMPGATATWTAVSTPVPPAPAPAPRSTMTVGR
ncbi:MAG: hypothetical protein AVDCRST_MAG24-553 [uncultured Nocardioidaceae bacterium]|uniref:Uncharacterized protein n=1 Tax=uncultured Nocardioidaceae bacterium TaxID=253824 RepID=A0A6J4L826_9ACTN|nr:MAG: hypothetical protein AVDCRST_MAG24-553 [uncultured Nocardioidaceae bacterium]